MSSSDHIVYSAIFRSAFTKAVVEECELFAAQIVRRELARMAEESERAPAVGVQPEQYLNSMPFTIFVRVFFGVLPETEQFTKLEAVYRVIDYRQAWRTPRWKVMGALDDATL
jgi:hypothetical protein